MVQLLLLKISLGGEQDVHLPTFVVRFSRILGKICQRFPVIWTKISAFFFPLLWPHLWVSALWGGVALGLESAAHGGPCNTLTTKLLCRPLTIKKLFSVCFCMKPFPTLAACYFWAWNTCRKYTLWRPCRELMFCSHPRRAMAVVSLCHVKNKSVPAVNTDSDRCKSVTETLALTNVDFSREYLEDSRLGCAPPITSSWPQSSVCVFPFFHAVFCTTQVGLHAWEAELLNHCERVRKDRFHWQKYTEAERYDTDPAHLEVHMSEA